MNSKIFIAIVGLLISTHFFSCKKLIEVPAPVGQINSASVFANDATATSALVGLYLTAISTTGQMTTTGLILYSGLSSDEMYNTTSNANTDQFRENSLLPDNPLARGSFWTFGYKLIFQANNIIVGLENSKTVTPSLSKQLTAEAKLMRALCHYYLSGLFGDIPLVTSVDYKITGNQPRISVSQVLDQVIEDLKDAKQNLAETYTTSGRVRPNKWTASALLARAYLKKGMWAEAEAEATAVIGSGQYSILSNLNNVFLGTNNNEAIWQMLPPNVATFNSIPNVFIPGTNVVPNYPLTNWLVNAFEPNDQRKSNWLKSITVNGTTYYYPFKYKVKSGAPVTEYYMMVRLAEIYLIRAEARTQQNNISGAVSDLNLIRTRAGLSSLSSSLSKANCLLAVEQERRVELFCEWGDRWLTLQRLGRGDAVLGPIKPGWQTTDILYPIPTSEILSNPSLTQNPGY